MTSLWDFHRQWVILAALLLLLQLLNPLRLLHCHADRTWDLTRGSLCRLSRRWAGRRRWQWIHDSWWRELSAAWRLLSSCWGWWLHLLEKPSLMPYMPLREQINLKIKLLHFYWLLHNESAGQDVHMSNVQIHLSFSHQLVDSYVCSKSHISYKKLQALRVNGK